MSLGGGPIPSNLVCVVLPHSPSLEQHLKQSVYESLQAVSGPFQLNLS